MGGPDPGVLAAVLQLTREALAARPDRLLVLGICGAQGSGKSTLAAALVRALSAEGTATALLSLDDLYLPRAARLRLATDVHPLFATRGVPGTHDVALGLAVLDALERGEPVPLPRFDKARDEPVPRADWPLAPAHCRVLILEGWCLGARPQAQAELSDPVNDLERLEDPQGVWRGHANAALGGAYRQLFDRVDRLVLLAAPAFEVVAGWRGEQEQALRERSDAPAAMDHAAIGRFIQHYERLTRHILREMPPRADLLVPLDERRRLVEIVRQSSGQGSG